MKANRCARMQYENALSFVKIGTPSRSTNSTWRYAKAAAALFLVSLLTPLAAKATYIDMALGQSLFCGLLDNGQTDCYTTNFREPVFLNADPSLAFTEIAAGAYTFCGITTSQEVSCWADDTDGMLYPPDFDFPVVQLSVEGWYACAVDSGDNAKCWGQNVHGQTNPPNEGAGFIDVTTEFSSACGLRADSTVECWGTQDSSTTDAFSVLPAEATNLSSIQFSRSLHCGIQDSGNALCWNPTGELVAQFVNGPYKQIMPVQDYPHTKVVCAETMGGELDCTSGELVQDGDIIQLATTVERLPNAYEAMDNGRTSNICAYHVENGLECPVNSRGVSGIDQRLLDLVNRDLTIPIMVVSDAAYYGFGVEIFYSAPDISEYTHSVFYDVDIFRNGEFLTRTENAHSYVDRTVEDGQDYSYAVRSVHLYGQIGDLSNSISIRASPTESDLGDNPVSARASEPTGLRAEVYWFDVELFWDRDNSGNVRNYEIRRDGELVATTRGTSWYDNTTEGDHRYVYDVIAVANDNSILGFRSVAVQIGETQCH